MFVPNSKGKLARFSGRDVYARASFSAPFDCPFSPVNLKASAAKTDRRADSSASRGSADEVTARAVILVPAYINPSIGDRFSFSGAEYLIQAVHPRRTVFGALDHYECDLEVLPACG